MSNGICPDCNEQKELTVHGDCFRCHIKGLGLSIPKPCKDCGNAVRIAQKNSTKITFTDE